MHERNDADDDRPLRIASLFSGYGGLDLSVEVVFDTRTIWFSKRSTSPSPASSPSTGPTRRASAVRSVAHPNAPAASRCR